ncbi:MAG: lipopolysaccharide export system permease protein [Abditibacteriota bacterium]|nr:lipopolysaccharide export system permease protein [Abditibacteriota bacterium]
MATAAPVSPPPFLGDVEATPEHVLLAKEPPHARKAATAGHTWWRVTHCDRAYAREMLAPMSIGLLVLILVLAGNFVYWAINSIVNQGLGLAPVVRLFLLAAPGFAVQGIPVGVILGVCLVLNRAVRDNEVIALRVGGASIPRILAPFLVMALLAALVDWGIVEKVAPKTNQMAESSLMKLMSSSAAPLIESDKYFRAGKYYFYVQSVENKVLKNVMVYERGSGNFAAIAPTTFPSVFIAKSAREDPKRPNLWVFESVIMHLYDDQGRQKSEWPIARVEIPIAQELSTYWADQKGPFSLTSDELSKRIEDLDNAAFDPRKLQEWRVDYYRRFALPFACFVMALLAAPLALRFARHGSFAGLVCAFTLAFFWQGFDGWFRALGIAGRLDPMAAAWSTNVLFLLAGSLLLWRER